MAQDPRDAKSREMHGPQKMSVALWSLSRLNHRTHLDFSLLWSEPWLQDQVQTQNAPTLACTPIRRSSALTSGLRSSQGWIITLGRSFTWASPSLSTQERANPPAPTHPKEAMWRQLE